MSTYGRFWVSPEEKSLKKGDTGRDVEVMQDWLQMASDYLALGFNMNVNGKFDFATMLTLCTVQRTFMTETGIYDHSQLRPESEQRV